MEATVHKPPMISVNVSNRDYAWQVEMCTNLAQRKVGHLVTGRFSTKESQTFICQSQKDYDKLVSLNGTPYQTRRQSNGKTSPPGKVALHLAVIDYNEETANPPRPCTAQKVGYYLVSLTGNIYHSQMAELGLDGFAIDFVEANGPVIAFLNQSAGLHRAVRSYHWAIANTCRALHSALGMP